jgi:hypothetical protein
MRYLIFTLFTLILMLTSPISAWSYTLDVHIDTSTLNGTPVALAFDFINGDDVVNNSVRISHFITDSNFDSSLSSSVGNASGALHTNLTLNDAEFLNEYLQPMVLENAIQFRIDTSQVYLQNSVPDAFSFFILDGTNFLPLFPTNDPTGANALLVLDLDDSPTGLAIYNASNPGPTWTIQPVPLPGAFSMMLLAGLWTCWLKRKHG